MLHYLSFFQSNGLSVVWGQPLRPLRHLSLENLVVLEVQASNIVRVAKCVDASLVKEGIEGLHHIDLIDRLRELVCDLCLTEE